MRKKIVLLIVTLVLVVGAYTGYKYLYRDHRSIEDEVAVLRLNALEMQQLFVNNESAKVLNNTVTVVGKITQIEDRTVTLDDKVACTFDKPIENITVGQTISIKGRCIGYDDLFEIVKLDQSTLNNPK